MSRFEDDGDPGQRDLSPALTVGEGDIDAGLRPRSLAEFIGQASVVLGDVLSDEAAGRVRARVFGLDCVLRAAPGQTARRGAEICLRPDDIGFAEAGAQDGHATIRRMSYRGGAFALEVAPDAAPETALRLGVREPTTLATGGRLTLAISDGWVIPAPRP